MRKRINKYKMMSNRFKLKQRMQNWLNSRVVHLKDELAREFDAAVVKKANEILQAKYRYYLSVKCVGFDRGSPSSIKMNHAKWENGHLVHKVEYVELELINGMAINMDNLTPEQAMYVNIGVQQAKLLFNAYNNHLEEKIPKCFRKNIDYSIEKTVNTRNVYD